MTTCPKCGNVQCCDSGACEECPARELALLRQKLAASERELDDVRELDELACRHGTELDIPAEIPGFDPGDGSDHLHFVLMPIGARSRRAAVEYLAKLDKAGG